MTERDSDDNDSDDNERDDDDRDDDDSNNVEPPPEGRAPYSGMTLDPVPFGSPPPEPVIIDGELPWELREEVPLSDE